MKGFKNRYTLPQISQLPNVSYKCLWVVFYPKIGKSCEASQLEKKKEKKRNHMSSCKIKLFGSTSRALILRTLSYSCVTLPLFIDHEAIGVRNTLGLNNVTYTYYHVTPSNRCKASLEASCTCKVPSCFAFEEALLMWIRWPPNPLVSFSKHQLCGAGWLYPTAHPQKQLRLNKFALVIW